MSQRRRVSLATVVVDGPIALHARRLLAARRREVGLQVLRMEQMAAQLAGVSNDLHRRKTLMWPYGPRSQVAG